jgi:hypothetical protein
MSGSDRGVLGFRMSVVHELRLLRSERCGYPMELRTPRGDGGEKSGEEMRR